MKVKTVIYTVFILLLLYFAASTVIASDPKKKEDAGYLAAEFSLDNDRYEWGISACDWVLEDLPRSTRILEKKSELLFAMGRYDEALAVKESVAAYSPESMDAGDWESLGGLYVKAGDYRSAVFSYEKALLCCTVPGNDSGIQNAAERADLLIKLQRYGEAVEIYNSLIEEDPDNVAAWIGLGDAYLYSSLLTKGQIEDMYESLDMDRPEGAESADLDMNQFESHRKAVSAYNRAVEIDPLAYPLVAAKILGGYEKTVESYQDVLEGMN